MKFQVFFLLGLLLSAGCVAEEPADNQTINDSQGNASANNSAENITSFEECVQAGYPVMESYPRQCRTPDGKTFESLSDRFEISKNTSCNEDSDCLLVNRELGFSCCWAGVCEAVNYSEDKWIAVNRKWFNESREQYCPRNCGPRPPCFVEPLNINYSARCIGNQCEKVPNIRKNVSPGNFSTNESRNETSAEPEGIYFADDRYVLVLGDVVLPAYDSVCGAFSVRDSSNLSVVDNLLICEGNSQTWISPEGQEYRIVVVEVAAGYTKEVKWAEVIIYG
ncbi:hypothetical protein GF318_04315 [Candidatus Micrarchaeota archaeon]|nr:hypothetical protein [Candidatus Micrarchaeota archaeon]